MLRILLPAIIASFFFTMMAALYLLNEYHHNQLESYIESAYLEPPLTIKEETVQVLDFTKKEFFIVMPRLMNIFSKDTMPPLKIIAQHKTNPQQKIEFTIDSTALHEELYDVFNLLLWHSLIIVAAFGIGLFFILHYFLARPLQRLTENINYFQQNPEGATRIITPSARLDEVGRAERALAKMQITLRNLLQEKSRLARLGLAVSKINHDMRNILANAQLISENFTQSKDASLRPMAQRLTASLERGIALCTQFLNYSRPETRVLNLSALSLHQAIAEVGEELALLHPTPHRWINHVPVDMKITTAPDHLFRILMNISKNALEATADQIIFNTTTRTDTLILDICDNGPGLSLRARANLFLPFSGSSGTGGGFGLGLPIAQELARELGGDLAIKETGANGTTFSLTLPLHS